MAGDFYTLKLIADIDDKKSDSEIQKYISEIQKKVSTDEKSKLKITVTPIMDRVQDPNNAKKVNKCRSRRQILFLSRSKSTHRNTNRFQRENNIPDRRNI